MKKLIFMISLLLLTVACTTGPEQDPVYQATVNISSETIVIGYAPSIVYEADVVETNRILPDVVLLDFTRYLEESQGTLPFAFGEEFSVRLTRQNNNTFRVEQSFYDY